MRHLMTAGALLLAAALMVACSNQEKKQYGGELDATPAAAPAASESSPAMATATEPEPAAEASESTDVASAGAGAGVLAKSGDTLFVAGKDGLRSVVGDDVSTVMDGEVVSVAVTDDGVWAAGPAMVKKLDGTVEIVPKFASPVTKLAVSGGTVYVGTAGEGIWRLDNGEFESVSPEWDVTDLAGTDFGIFAATTDGLFSFDGERWHRRQLGDSSTALAAPGALYYRYPYLYVADGTDLLRYDGSSWEEFAEISSDEITALGWHNARLYIGALDGTLRTLDGTVVEEAAAPDSLPIESILRFDKRLHVATADGVYRQRFGKFEKLDLEEATKSETKTEPIASL